MKESVDAGISPFPSIRDSFILNELKVKQMERALENSLDDEERMILEKKYLAASQTKDIHIYMELGMKKGTCYEIKQRAIVRIATALGII
ncbi:ArpU family phage packaging/lysis transcriptional regulator [Bacillus velezensis]|uniref:ArpU family phage packaging/lysis transcriptional regulator n=1 Tax=Bacillus TaxID=1386 RepID=UPI0007CDED60|nr:MULTISPECIES: ArpU family phage packaging/lysis transcriptional regulator [Bacillus]GFR53420.1 ArpU family transcriptional regulator [Bacillus sp. CN2]ANF36683.1 ArpU family transcriptional regulator [Bacillus velezensis]ARZ58119.1 ArpU family transcriptional regulator [Bacillus velezensis]MCF6447062.1 ArpU family transcriptional regulator [Bacillus sp. MMG021]MCP8610755.1 ArpU family transcriptional regulator [Bacillus velezensis]